MSAPAAPVPLARSSSSSCLKRSFSTPSMLIRPEEGFQSLMRSMGGGTAIKNLRDANRMVPGMWEAREKKKFADDVHRLNARLREQKRCLLDPRGHVVQYWDMATGLALLYTMFVTPYELSLIHI